MSELVVCELHYQYNPKTQTVNIEVGGDDLIFKYKKVYQFSPLGALCIGPITTCAF